MATLEVLEHSPVYRNPHSNLVSEYVAFPSIRALPDDTLLCMCRHATARESTDGVVVIHRSTDGGVSWERAGDLPEASDVAEGMRLPGGFGITTDGETIAFLPQEYPKFNVTDYYTKGISFHHLPSGNTREHVNTKPLHHLYNISYAPNGKWIVATVHAGMGHRHTNLLIEANGSKVINLGIDGCRPTFSPDGKHIAWGAGDHELAVVPIDIESDNPKLGKKIFQVFDKQNKIYHVDWSPDGRFLSFSRGPNGKGDITKPGTYEAACEIVGVHAKGWDIFAVKVARGGSVTIGHKPVYDWQPLTHNGNSNKESDWFLPPSK